MAVAKTVRPNLQLSIVMPCLNEADTIGCCITKAQQFLVDGQIDGEILIGDNGSTDGSQQIARTLGARVIDVPVRGYGAALYAACQAAQGRHIILGDSDDSYDFSDLSGFLHGLRSGFDLVMGNRFSGCIKRGAMPWKNRYIGNPVLSGVGRLLFKCPIRDFHCGIRGLSKLAFEEMDLKTTGMEFASEMVIKASLLQMRISEVPTTLSPDGRSRPPHLRPWRDGWRHLRFMLLFSPNWVFLYPGALIMFLCCLACIELMLGPATIAGFRFTIATMVYSSFGLLTGFQAVLFSLLSRQFAARGGLYPANSPISTIVSHFRLETGLVSGTITALLGIMGTLWAFLDWKQHAFGLMDPERLSRLVIPAATATAVGVEVVLFSLLFSTLQLGLRHSPAGSQRSSTGATSRLNGSGVRFDPSWEVPIIPKNDDVAVNARTP